MISSNSFHPRLTQNHIIIIRRRRTIIDCTKGSTSNHFITLSQNSLNNPQIQQIKSYSSSFKTFLNTRSTSNSVCRTPASRSFSKAIQVLNSVRKNPLNQFDYLRTVTTTSKGPSQEMIGAEEEPISLPVTAYPKFDKNSRVIKRAACVIIGDEILNGKTLDTNSNHLAKTLFGLGISLNKIEVIPDNELKIIDCIKELAKDEDEFDLIITSGGIGPTHDDITYQSLAKVFDPQGKLKYDEQTMKRMIKINQNKPKFKNFTIEQFESRKRMALFPEKFIEILFVDHQLWVPVICLKSKIFILPGIPTLFKQLLQSLVEKYLNLPSENERPNRILVETDLPESLISNYLSKLSSRLKDDQIRIGSYPNLIQQKVYVSIIGNDLNKIKHISNEVKDELEKIKISSNL